MVKPIINCIRLSGASIPAIISEALAIESVSLYRSADGKKDFAGEKYSGRIKTDRESMSFFGASGVYFEAHIEYEAPDKTTRKTLALYIVTPGVLQMDFGEGYEFMTQDIDELLSEADSDAAEIIRDHMAKFGNDPLSKTAGSC